MLMRFPSLSCFPVFSSVPAFIASCEKLLLIDEDKDSCPFEGQIEMLELLTRISVLQFWYSRQSVDVDGGFE